MNPVSLQASQYLVLAPDARRRLGRLAERLWCPRTGSGGGPQRGCSYWLHLDDTWIRHEARDQFLRRGRPVVYVEFVIWLLLIVFCGIGVYRLWAQVLRPAWLGWVLLPATLVSEMAYIFGCLITGGEIRRAKLLSSFEKSDPGEPTTQAAPRWKVFGPITAALVAILACGAAIGLADRLLGEPVMREFRFASALADPADQPAALASWDALWARMENQLRLLRRTCETFARLDWLDWRVWLFVYLAMCLSVRLAPVRRDLRATLAAAVILAVMIVLIGAVTTRFDQILQAARPILTYVWGNLLLLLAVSLLARGLIALVRVLAGKAAE